MLFYGVVSDSLQEALEFFPTREEAEAIVQAWDRDEPYAAADAGSMCAAAVRPLSLLVPV